MEVYVPYETIVDRLGKVNVAQRSGSSERTEVQYHQLVCAIDSETNVVHAARGIQTILAKMHDRRDYEVTVPLELLQSQQRAQRVFNIVLPIIAAISLLVGGIGILNIMLATITERTSEIGIRRAIGASSRDITLQFLTETVTLSSIGGLLGLLVGLGGIQILKATTHWQAATTPGALALAMGISCLTGIVFGIYPRAQSGRDESDRGTPARMTAKVTPTQDGNDATSALVAGAADYVGLTSDRT